MNRLAKKPRLHVCSLDRIDKAVEETGARSLVTLLSHGTPVRRPPAILPERHLFIAMSDIINGCSSLACTASGMCASFCNSWPIGTRPNPC